jgi:hypothetical protein
MGGEISRPPCFLLSAKDWLLCDLAVGLGFEDLLAADIDLDLLGLSFGLLGKVDLQAPLS